MAILVRALSDSTSRMLQTNHNRIGLKMLLLLLLAAGFASSGSVNDCHGVRYAYRERGIDLRDVPRQPRQGSQLQICPRGLTCCTEDMEAKLRDDSQDKYKKALKTSANGVQRLFNSRAHKFDEFFTDLLATSKLKFHKLFQKTYGIIYERNSDVFIDFFKDLEKYYDDGQIDLDVALNKFFEQLYQRMFTVLNTGRNFDYVYMSCVSKTMKTLLPFGDVPKKLTDQLRRSFVATRTFSQALLQGKKVVNKILEIDPKDRCVVALTKMSSCPACQGIPEIRPCPDYCINVMKGCLAYHAELGDSWDRFIEHLQILGDRLIGPFDIEAVVDPIGVKISEAIMNFQASGISLTEKVYQECGPGRRLNKRDAPYGDAYGSSSSSGGGSSSSYYHPDDEETKLKALIKDIKESVGKAKGFWTTLPYTMCEEDSVGTGRQRSSGQDNGKCWNGKDAGDYRSVVVNDGLMSQSSNPEVQVDVSRPDVDINEQIFKLKLMSKKLENAYKGQDVEWPSPSTSRGAVSPSSYDTGADYEGSGGCDYSDDEDCYEYDYYGSGSGDYEDSGDDGSNGYDDSYGGVAEDDEEDGGVENWPPWIPKNKEDDIKLEESNNGGGNNANETPKKTTTTTTTSTTAGVGAVSPPGSVFLLLVFLLLSVMSCWLGGL